MLLTFPETLKDTRRIAEAAEVEADQEESRDSPQSRHSRQSTLQSVHRHTTKCMKILRMLFVDPLRILLYFRYPPVLLTAYYASITFGSLYFLNISIQASFERPPYSYPTLIVGLLYLPASAGYLSTSLAGGHWADRIMRREAVKAGRYDKNGKLHFLPEDRMRENAWLGAIMYPLALIVYGWTVQKGVHVAVPVCIQVPTSHTDAGTD
jgi:hypothetical protein